MDNLVKQTAKEELFNKIAEWKETALVKRWEEIVGKEKARIEKEKRVKEEFLVKAKINYRENFFIICKKFTSSNNKIENHNMIANLSDECLVELETLVFKGAKFRRRIFVGGCLLVPIVGWLMLYIYFDTKNSSNSLEYLRARKTLMKVCKTQKALLDYINFAGCSL